MRTFKKNKLRLFASFLVFIAWSCEEKEPDQQPDVPTNLNFTVDVSDDGSGDVTLTATAENAEYYDVFFGEPGNDNPVRSLDGTATYTYAASGSYTIKVQAHRAITAFISKTQSISVEVDPPPTGELVIPTEGYTTPTTYNNMSLVWQDEFDAEVLNESDWTYEIGGGGWGNNELQFYRRENTSLQDGYLVITAKKENYQGRNYTSSRLITKDKKIFKYGRIDIRAVLPEGQGIWPALWMLGNNIGSVGWPKCGEIDIMEMIGGQGREKTVHGTLHWDITGHVCTCDKPNSSHTLASGNYNDKFHVFSIIWDESKIRWYMDDNLFNTIDITPEHMSEFHEEFFFIFNVAVGGNWPGSPDNSTVFSQYLIVDYIRVFQNQ